jgi:hypothetical protein
MMTDRRASSNARLESQKRALIEALAAARASVLEALALIPPGRLSLPFLGSWSALDLLAHLQGWDITNWQAVQQIVDGQYPAFFQHYDKDWRSYNARLVAQYRREDFESQLAETRQSHAELLAFLDSLPAQILVNGKARRETGRSVSIHNLLKAEASDERHHADQVWDTVKAYIPPDYGFHRGS